MDDQRKELTPEEFALAQEAWFSCERETAIISAAFGLIVSTQSEAWLPWAKENDLGIPYALGIEMGDIEENGLTPKGLSIIQETYKNLCKHLEVEKIFSVENLHTLMINSSKALKKDEEEKIVED